MKVTFSPLVSGLSGKAADAVAATWKGRSYIRKHVIPHNPQSAAQTLVRESLARCVTLWRSLAANTKLWLDTYGTGYQMSGYNVFMQKSRALEQAGSILVPVPANPHCAAPSDASFVTGAGVAGDIDLTWTEDGPAAYTHILGIARRINENFFHTQVTSLVGDAKLIISDLDVGEDYDCYCFYLAAASGIMGTSHGQLAVTSKA